MYFEREFSSPSFYIHVNGAIGNGGVQIIKDLLILNSGYNLALTDAVL